MKRKYDHKPEPEQNVKGGEGLCNHCYRPIHPVWVYRTRGEADMVWRHTGFR